MRQLNWIPAALAVPALALALACGGRDAQTLGVEPQAPAVQVGETLVLTASPQFELSGDLDWEVQETYGGGLLQSQGPRVTYVPPESAGTYHLILRAPIRNGRVMKEVVEVQVLASPVLEPAAPRIQPGASLQFRARMKGLPKDTVTWSVEEPDGGEIGPDGRYTAPRRPGIYHVAATSAVDPATIARATVTVAAD